MEKKTRTIFTKKFMINELKKMREDLIENQMITSEITKKYSTLYCYKIFENLIFRGYIKLVDKQGKTSFYKWNFDRKLNYNLFDLLYNHGLKERNKIQQKSKNVNKNLILEEPQIELKKESQNYFENENIKKNVFGKSLMRKCLYSGNLFVPTRPNQLFENTKARTDYHNSYYRSVDKIIKETNEKEKKDLLIYVGELEQKIKNLELELHNYKSDISNDDLKKQNPKSFIENTKQKPIKYLKLFGIKIYEKN
jgi:hypothetical protein